MAPINVPIITPAKISSKLSDPSEINVEIIAISIPTAARVFPDCALFGWLSFLIPRINKTEAST